jgi:hypothetical protein
VLEVAFFYNIGEQFLLVTVACMVEILCWVELNKESLSSLSID